MIVLETERLFLRHWVPDDWIRFKPLATDPQVTRYLGHGHPWSDEQVQHAVAKWSDFSQSRGWTLWPVIHRDDAKLIGFCGFAFGFPPDVEIGWRLLPEYWGQGLATEAATAVLAYGFERWRFSHVIAVAQPANIASTRVMEKIGMHRDGEFTHDGIPVVRYKVDNPHRPAVDHSLSDTVTIRSAEPTDIPAITEIYNEAIRESTATFDTEPKSEQAQMDWFLARDESHPVFVAEIDSKVVGWAALSQWSDRPAYSRTAESSMYVLSEFQGRGIGRKLKERLTNEARRVGLHTILARAAEGSDASIHLNESVGFRRIGVMREVGFKFGRMLDVHLMQLTLGESG